MRAIWYNSIAALLLATGTCVAAKPQPFQLAPRSNGTMPAPMLGCGGNVFFPGTEFSDGVWTYGGYSCSEYWAFDYVVNITSAPQIFNQVARNFSASTVVISNTGSCAGFDYSVTTNVPNLNDVFTWCSGTLEPGDSPVTCTGATVPGQVVGVQPVIPSYVDIHIHNRNWVCAAAGEIDINQTCQQTQQPAGADLCSNGEIYVTVDPNSGLPIYATGGCVTDIALDAGCDNDALYCCANGQAPAATTDCNDAFGYQNCYNCTGGC